MQWKGSYVFGTAGAAFRGYAADNAPHTHATLQIVVSVDGPAVIDRPGCAPMIGSHLLIRPGVVHALRPIEKVTLVFLEPQTAAAQRILALAFPGDVTELPADLRPAFRFDAPLADGLAAIENVAATAADERVERALAYLAGATGPRAVARAAAAANLSPSRLRALAHEQLGTPLTAWLAWRRLERAGKAIAAGASLAEAAIDAGFADQAHLSRVTRQVFGITPGTAGGVVRPQAKASRPG
jgi:AraC-like DNA-binding protein